MHILFIPKWYPGRKDPQLGDFLRKQAIAVGGRAQVSVLHVQPIMDLEATEVQEVVEEDGIYELKCLYKNSAIGDPTLRKLVNLPRYWRAAMNGSRRIMEERGRPDLQHVHILMRPAMLAYALRRKYGIPFLISEQSSQYLDGSFRARGPLVVRMARFLFSQASTVTAVSSWLGDALLEQGLIKKYEVVPNVIPGLDRPLPPAGDPRHFLVVADLVDKTKNVSGVIRALSKAREEEPGLRLSVIGDGPDRRMLEDLVKAHGLGTSVHFVGQLPNKDVLDLMATTGTVIINSNVETFSVVTGEALALGKPVIATRCGGPIAFVTPENGILIEPRDDNALMRAMLSMARAPHKRSPETIRASVSERFSYDAVGDAFMKIYKRILHHGK